MELHDKTIEEYFQQLDVEDVKRSSPHNIDYIARYKENSGKLYRDVHPLVEKGAAILDKVYLNDHGVNHIKTVIQRASQLVSTEGLVLSPYELYVLLMGIHLHDIGNIKGREKHEEKIEAVIAEIDSAISSIIFTDDVEKETILNIARAHGGSYDNLLSLDKEMRVLDKKVRAQYLAAIIRLADEISDDVGRASTLLLGSEKLPKEAIIFHLYSHCLKTSEFNPESKCISYIFWIKEKYLHEKFLLNGVEVFLIDEIYSRTLKTFKESVVCTKFLRPYIYIDKVRVSINLILEETDIYGRHKKIQLQYDIDDMGYPEIDFVRLCPKMAHLTGEFIAEKLKNKQFEDVRC